MRTNIFAILTAMLLPIVSAQAQVTVFDHATLIDGTGAAPQRDVTIVVERGRISSIITPPAVLALPADATHVDLTGKFVVPGIINGHGHVGPAPRDPQLRRYALYGVTTTTSMSFDSDDIAAFKLRQRSGDLRGARILTVKYRFMSPPFRPGSEDKTPEEARARVDDIVEKGADFVKVWIDSQGGRRAKLPREISSAVLDQGRKHRKITMSHVVELADARAMVEDGVNILAHDVRDQEIPADFLATIKAKNVSVISTLAREEGMFIYGGDGGGSRGYADDPFFRKGLTPDQAEKLAEKRTEQAKERDRPQAIRAFEIDKINVKKLSDAGVRLVFGTDSGGDLNRYFIQGFYEHRQMELLRDAGLTPMQIIQTFSKNTSEALGIDKEFGTLAEGKAADFLVLTKNPLDAITNMRAIETVYLGGKKFE
jgi:imidazolonepropionase-like amidohydrolase